jgi:hypothetical protein
MERENQQIEKEIGDAIADRERAFGERFFGSGILPPKQKRRRP